jgi:erythromycin esterase
MSAIDSEVKAWIGANALPLESVAAGSGFEDLAPLRDVIGGARVVGLGEATHGTREFFQLKHRLLEFLVSELGFTLFAFEASFSETWPVSRYVLTGEGDAGHSLASIRLWSWDSEEVLELIEWMRAWNAEHERKVYFYGCDVPRQSAAAAVFLLDHLERRDPEAYDRLRESLLPLATDVEALDWLSRSEAENDDARAAISDAVATLAGLTAVTEDEQYELDVARLHASTLEQAGQRWADLSQQRMEVARDRAMADNFARLLELHGPDSKAVLWAHDTHVSLRSYGLHFERPPIGEHLREMFGDGYVSFGTAFDHGSFAALDEAFEIREYSVPSVPGTLDAALAEAGPPIFALDLRSVPSGVADWFAAARPSRIIGGVYYPEIAETLWASLDKRELFDALLFVRETAAARSCTTASSMWEWERQETPAPAGLVTLDFSAGMLGWRMPPQASLGAYEVGLMNENGGPLLEISRAAESWPWDSYALSQTAPAEPWHGKRITVRCSVGVRAAHDGSSAQLAARVLTSGPAPASEEALYDTDGWARSVKRRVWQRATTRDAQPRELSITVEVPETADVIALALVMKGDGRARFGPVTIDESNEG